MQGGGDGSATVRELKFDPGKAKKLKQMHQEFLQKRERDTEKGDHLLNRTGSLKRNSGISIAKNLRREKLQAASSLEKLQREDSLSRKQSNEFFGQLGRLKQELLKDRPRTARPRRRVLRKQIAE